MMRTFLRTAVLQVRLEVKGRNGKREHYSHSVRTHLEWEERRHLMEGLQGVEKWMLCMQEKKTLRVRSPGPNTLRSAALIRAECVLPGILIDASLNLYDISTYHSSSFFHNLLFFIRPS